MTQGKWIAALLLGALTLGACAAKPGVGSAPESAVTEPAPESAASVTEETGIGEVLPLEVGKVVPGCRSTLVTPLKMRGTSTAVDFSRWTATDLDGNPVNQEILKGSKLTLVNVWATFCGGHVEDLEALEELYASYPRSDLNVVGIVASSQFPDGTTNDDEIGYVKYLLEMTGASYPQLLPSDDLIQIRLKDLGTIPESFLLDSQGNLVGEAWIGSRTADELREIIDAVNPSSLS